MSHFIHKIQHHIRKHSLLQSGDSVLTAVSGGVDSVVMLDVLLSLRDQWNLTVAVAHFNHQLRGEESEGDEEFVRDLAHRHKVECFVEKADTSAEATRRRRSLQAAARDLRYEFFGRLRDTHGFTRAATAHNADDNAETILLNLARGAGVRGLSGIPILREEGHIVRPLLGVTREEIETYAKERALTFRTDSSNVEDHYTRNFLRHSIVPLLKDRVNPNLTATLSRTAELFRDLDAFLSEKTGQILSKIVEKNDGVEVVVRIHELKSLPLYLQDHGLLLIAQEFTKGDVDFSTVKSLLNLTVAETGSTYALTEACIVVRDRDRLVFRHALEHAPFVYRIEPDRAYQFDRFRFSSVTTDSFRPHGNGMVEFIDADRLGSSLVLRTWAEGDWFYPLGMDGKKKLSDFFVDAKIPLYEKHSIPVLESDGSIVWVCGKRIDNRFKVGETTKRILKLEYVPSSGSANIS